VHGVADEIADVELHEGAVAQVCLLPDLPARGFVPSARGLIPMARGFVGSPALRLRTPSARAATRQSD
jgi:hypothetical protein